MNKEQIKKATELFLIGIGENYEREGLEKTPARVADMMSEILGGYLEDIDDYQSSIFEDDSSDLVLVKDISFFSICEHHLVPFFGKAHVAYIPNGKLIGLSKIPRALDVFGRRLQVQERLWRYGV